MTAWFTVTARALQPVSIGKTNAKAFLTRTEPLITGATLRGALAAWWLRRKGQDATFRELFDGEVRFGPLIRDDCLLENLSVTACKYHQGDQHPRYFDRAFHTGAQPVCGGVPEPLKGRIISRTGGGAGLAITTSTAINPSTGTALDAALYSRESNAKGATFTGSIVGDPALVGQLPTQVRLTFGGRCGVQGAADVSIKASPAPAVPNGPVVVRSLSPIILVDAAGRPSVDLKAALEEQGFGFQGSNGVFAGRVTTEGAGGWHAASGLPKPTDLALARGSVTVLDGDPAAVAKLLDRGIGIRRAEGFGFLELVTSAWSVDDAAEPGVRSAGQEAGAGLARWRERLGAVDLDHAQRTWLANQLREVRQGQHAEVTARLGRPNVPATLLQPQREAAEDVLLNCPDAHRQALAAELEGHY